MYVQQVNDDLLIRMMKVSEKTELFALIDRNRAFLQRWLAWVHQNKSVKDSERFIKHAFESYANRESLTAGIFYKDTLAGIIGFNSLDFMNKIGTIGYWMGEEFEGKGIMTASVKALIAHGFKNLQLNRLQLFAAVENHPSRAVAERLQFTNEGIVRENEWVNGKPMDQVLYSLLRREWN